MLILLAMDTVGFNNRGMVLFVPKFYHWPLPIEAIAAPIRQPPIWKQVLIAKTTAEVEDQRLQWFDALGSSADQLCMLIFGRLYHARVHCVSGELKGAKRAGEYAYCQSSTRNS